MMPWPGRPARARCGPGQGHVCALGWTEALLPWPGPILLHHTGPGRRAWEMPCSLVTRGWRSACSSPASDGVRVQTLAGAAWPKPLPGPAGRQLPKREGGGFGVEPSTPFLVWGLPGGKPPRRGKPWGLRALNPGHVCPLSSTETP